MTEQERINTELQTRLAVHDEKFNALIQSLADFKEESRREMADFKAEMRQQNAMRAAEMTEIRASISSICKHVDNMALATIIGVGAMVLSVIFAVIFK